MKLSGLSPLILLKILSTLVIREVGEAGSSRATESSNESAASNLFYMFLLQDFPDLDWVILYVLQIDSLTVRERESNKASCFTSFVMSCFNLLII